MSTFSISQWLPKVLRSQTHQGERHLGLPLQRPSLNELAQQPLSSLPPLIQESAIALRYLRLLGDITWQDFPVQADERIWFEMPPIPLWSFAAANLVKLDQHLPYMSSLRQYLRENPALLWVLGFPLVGSERYPCGFDTEASLPTERHLSRLLRDLPYIGPQFVLSESVRLIRAALPPDLPPFGECVAVDTKHIIAWAKENNPKAYVQERYDKEKQPKGDPDCKLGCKRQKNQGRKQATPEGVTTPLTNPLPAGQVKVGEYYWGYGSGLVVTKVDGWGEFVITDLTQTFDHSDVSYFFPLMAAAERQLGFHPKYGALDAAYDAFYVYEYFHQAGGFAAVPLVEKSRAATRTFDAAGLPQCAAGLAMPLKATFLDRTSLIIEHERGQYVCPLLFPHATGATCPINDPHWVKGGCLTTMATSIGARIRHQLDREGAAYQNVYRQRTAAERINSQAKELGIERPKLRNEASIRNTNTLTYSLINLYALERIRQHKANPRG